MTSSTPSPRSTKRHPAATRPTARAVEVDAWKLTDLVTRLRRVLRSSIRTDFPWETLPMAQVEILQRLAEEPGLRVSDLARRHRLAANTVSNLIQQMVVTGLVVRAEKPSDRRSVTLQLTETGASSLAEWQAAHERRLNGALTFGCVGQPRKSPTPASSPRCAAAAATTMCRNARPAVGWIWSSRSAAPI